MGFSPYEHGRQVGMSFGAARQEASDQGNIKNILAEAQASGDPQVLQNSIGRILSSVSKENQPAAINYIQNMMASAQTKQDSARKNVALQKAGFQPDLPESLNKLIYENQQNEAELDRFGLGARPTMQQDIQPQVQFRQQEIGGIQQPLQSEQKQQSFTSPIASKTDDELILMRGSKNPQIQRIADSELKRRQEERKANQSPFEPESDKLEAKRVSDLATEIENDYSVAKTEDMRLNRLNVLDEQGNISTSSIVKALDYFGLPIGLLSNPATEEFRKLESDFIRDVSKVFPGGKITNFEISSYMKTIPSLMNSPEGRKEIYRNRKLFNEAKTVRYNEYKKIIKENNGKKPANLGMLIEERTQDKIKNIEEQFVNGIQNALDKHQTPIRMYDPKGNPVDIPPREIERAMKAGAKFR
jgi:hypothetical protein